MYEPTDKMISQPSQLHHILQLVMSEHIPAARIQATVCDFGNLLSWGESITSVILGKVFI